MNKRLALPRLTTPMLAEDFSDSTIGKRPGKLTWIRRPTSKPTQDEQSPSEETS